MRPPDRVQRVIRDRQRIGQQLWRRIVRRKLRGSLVRVSHGVAPGRYAHLETFRYYSLTPSTHAPPVYATITTTARPPTVVIALAAPHRMAGVIRTWGPYVSWSSSHWASSYGSSRIEQSLERCMRRVKIRYLLGVTTGLCCELLPSLNFILILFFIETPNSTEDGKR